MQLRRFLDNRIFSFSSTYNWYTDRNKIVYAAVFKLLQNLVQYSRYAILVKKLTEVLQSELCIFLKLQKFLRFFL